MTGGSSPRTDPAGPDIAIRALEDVEDWIRAAHFQETIWGAGFPEKAPPSLMMVAARLGGVVAGAFEPDGEMVGFVFGITGVEGGRPVHWSDMLGVSPRARDRGLGTRLKRFQRDRLLELGVTRMYWSQDPLESRNGWLNLQRLGAAAVEYVVDMYGESSSPLHSGLGTDRFVIRWDLDSERVRRRLGQGARDVGEPGRDGAGELLPFVLQWRDGETGPRPVLPGGVPVPGDGPVQRDGLAPGDAGSGTGGAAWLDDVPGGFRVPIPARIQELKARDPELAAGWRRATRAVLRPALDSGWTVDELVRGGPVSEYVVRPPASVGP